MSIENRVCELIYNVWKDLPKCEICGIKSERKSTSDIFFARLPLEPNSFTATETLQVQIVNARLASEKCTTRQAVGRIFIVSLGRSNSARERGERPVREEIERVRTQAQALRRWGEALANPAAGHRTIEAIRPVLEKWVGRQWGSLTYRLVQVLTGLGSFGHYLHRVARREELPRCHHCASPDDTAEHTLIVCPAWRNERRTLMAALGGGPRRMARTILGNERAWKTAASFCEVVMGQKEAAEREREEDALAASLRRRRVGRRRLAAVTAGLRRP
ncbi:hypothetical protein evm_002131 [Chilo suppressalis]|nr:hypothetical protein evm_002131 [Chilo suppressalis]